MTSYRRRNDGSPLEVESSTAGASGGRDLDEAPLFEADVAELIIHSADSREKPLIEKVQVATVEALMDLARKRSSEGHPRAVIAVINGLPIAQFMGRWMWDTRGEFE